ncbi:hypothetical protein BJV78DRAFT_892749 [Lactifluus subvellereus]|nr:hypothetical protein BJV78DRAFT_892749 [Lactifluus subvellereus]
MTATPLGLYKLLSVFALTTFYDSLSQPLYSLPETNLNPVTLVLMRSLVSVDSVLGAFFIGVILSSILYGVIWLQIYLYFSRHCKRDRPFLKLFVVMLLILDSLQLAFLVHGYYLVGVTNFGDLIADRKAPWSLVVQTFIGIALSISTQQFYAWRIYKLSLGKIYIPILIVIMTFVELALGIGAQWIMFQSRALTPPRPLCLVYLVQCFRFPEYNQATVQIPITTAGLSLGVACDMTITSCMVYYLLARGSSMKRANTSPTAILVVYVVNSGALTLVFSISCLATFVRFPRTLIYAPFFFILVRLYSCSFMAILNSRDHIRTAFNSNPESGIAVVVSDGYTLPPGTTDVGRGVDSPDLPPMKMSALRSAEERGSCVGTYDGTS